jgi:hypothetical protein
LNRYLHVSTPGVRPVCLPCAWSYTSLPPYQRTNAMAPWTKTPSTAWNPPTRDRIKKNHYLNIQLNFLSSIFLNFWLSVLLGIVLSVLLGIVLSSFWTLCCLSFWALCCLSFWALCCLSFWTLCCLSFFNLGLLVSSNIYYWYVTFASFNTHMILKL